MNRTAARWMSFGLVFALLLGMTSDAWARYGSSQFRNYIQQQQKMQTQMMQMQQKAMMEAMARQAAMEKQRKENYAKATKARQEKEEQHRQDLIAKRKAEQAAKDGAAPRNGKE